MMWYEPGLDWYCASKWFHCWDKELQGIDNSAELQMNAEQVFVTIGLVHEEVYQDLVATKKWISENVSYDILE